MPLNDLTIRENKGCFGSQEERGLTEEICSQSNLLRDLEKTKGVLQWNFDAFNISIRSNWLLVSLKVSLRSIRRPFAWNEYEKKPSTTTPYEFAMNFRAMEGSNETPYEPPSNLGTFGLWKGLMRPLMSPQVPRGIEIDRRFYCQHAKLVPLCGHFNIRNSSVYNALHESL